MSSCDEKRTCRGITHGGAIVAMLRVALTLAAGFLTLACTQSTPPTDLFGARYVVRLQPDPPVLTAATVSLTVTYGGCRGSHAFSLQSQIHGSHSWIWLRKVTRDESCDMLVIERREFDVPDNVRGAASVVLLSPENEPLQLRP